MNRTTNLVGVTFILINSASAQFLEHPLEECETHTPKCVQAADMDGDGDLDVVVMSQEDPDLTWYANDGDGQFGPQQLIDDEGYYGEQFQLADLDGDSDIDIVASWSLIMDVTVHLNDGSGGFAPRTVITSMNNEEFQSLLTADLDGDADVDVIIGHDMAPMFTWLSNDGTGNFPEQQDIDAGISDPHSLEAWDVEGDGDLDLTYSSSLAAYWIENNGSGIFGTPDLIAAGLPEGLMPLHCADMEGDGDRDAIHVSNGILSWQENAGGAFVTAHPIVAVGLDISMIRTGDVEGDGDHDIVASYYASNRIAWYANDGTGTFAPEQTITFDCYGALWLALADLDMDGDEDVLSAAALGSFVAWQANENGTFGELDFLDNALNFTDGVLNPTADDLLSEDIDGDGDHDIMTLSAIDGKLAWFANNGSGVFGSQLVLATGMFGARDLELTDLDQDGDVDAICAWKNGLGSSVAWYSNNGQGDFSPPQLITDSLDSPFAVHVVDLNGDGTTDVLVKGIPGFVSYMNDGSGGLSPGPVITPDLQSRSAVDDVDGDGDIDLICDPYASGASWLPNDGNAVFGDPLPIGGFFEVDQYLSGDLDMDGDVDVLLRDNVNLVWYANNGTGTFISSAAIPLQVYGGSSMRLADMDNDGDPDIVGFMLQLDELAWSANDGSGNFGPGQIVSTGLIALNALGTGDLDGDGDMDVIGSTHENCALRWYEQEGMPDGLPPPAATLSYTFHIGPNPFSSQAVLSTSMPLTPDHTVQFVDAHGRLRAERSGTGSRAMTIDRGDLAPGVYAICILHHEQRLGAVRVVVE